MVNNLNISAYNAINKDNSNKHSKEELEKYFESSAKIENIRSKYSDNENILLTLERFDDRIKDESWVGGLILREDMINLIGIKSDDAMKEEDMSKYKLENKLIDFIKLENNFVGAYLINDEDTRMLWIVVEKIDFETRVKYFNEHIKIDADFRLNVFSKKKGEQLRENIDSFEVVEEWS